MSSSPEAHASTESDSTAHVLILHEVAEYAAWKRVFDSAAGMRRAAGEISYQVLRARENPNQVVHFSMWTSHSDAMRFFQSEELEEIRRQAGVKAPRFHYLHRVESGALQPALSSGPANHPME